MPSSFQSCEKERERTGCLYRYNDPDSQCRDNRTGVWGEGKEMEEMIRESCRNISMEVGLTLEERARKLKCIALK